MDTFSVWTECLTIITATVHGNLVARLLAGHPQIKGEIDVAVHTEELMRAWMEVQLQVRDRAVRQGIDEFFKVLGTSGKPALAVVTRASIAAREAVFAELTADSVMDTLPNAPSNAVEREALRSSLLSLSSTFDIAAPSTGRTFSADRMAAAASVGALIGMIVLGPVLHWTLDLRLDGIFLGALAGAPGAVLGVAQLSQNKTLRNALKTAFFAAGTIDIIVAALRGLWVGLAGLRPLRRIIFYGGGVALLVFTRGTVQYDLQAYRQWVEDRVRLWVDCASLVLCALSVSQNIEPQSGLRPLDSDMARAIHDLHGSDLAGLPTAAEAVLLEAQRIGLEGLDGQARFTKTGQIERVRLTWSQELAERYQPFGLVEEGDMVIVEYEPVIQNDIVLEKGRVRKQRF